MNQRLKLFIIGIALFCSCSLLINISSLSLANHNLSTSETAKSDRLFFSQNAIAQNNVGVSRFQVLAQGDELYRLGKVAEAEVLYRKAKSDFPSNSTATTEPTFPIYEATDLPEKGQQMWQKSLDGIDKGLDSKAFFNLQNLIKLYPEFINGHLKLAEFCLQEAEFCEKTAQNKYPANPRQILEQLTNKYPDDPEVLKAKIEFLDRAGEKDYDNYLEASITARQFSLFFVDYPEAPEFGRLADDYLHKYQGRLKTDLISSAVTCGALGIATDNLDSCTIINLMLQGESKFGSAISQQYVKQFQQENRLVEDSNVRKYIDGLAGRITPYLGRDFDYEFYIVNDDALNAFALPGGKIFINTGAIVKTKSEAELAGLIGHELSHAAFSHGYRRMAQSSLTSVIGNIVPLSNILFEITGKKYSRGNERQADILGTRVLSASGYAADGLRNMMLTLGGLEGQVTAESLNNANQQSHTNWQSTHPAPIDRVRYLEKLIVDNGYNRYAYEGVTSHQNIQQLLSGEVTPQNQIVTPVAQPNSNPTIPSSSQETTPTTPQTTPLF